MSKSEQVLVLEPPTELRFKGPFTDVVTAELKLRNPTDRKVCFKVKTTAPKRYCVRPNSGIIEGGNAVSVSVMLQPFDYDPSEKNKHKFMVQTMFAPDGPFESHESLWKDATPEDLMDSKLKCVFEMPIENSPISPSKPQEQEEKPTRPVKQVQLESSPPTKGSSPDNEVRKLIEDKQRLEGELEKLKEENRTIKESEVRLRKVAMTDTVSSTPSQSSSQLSSSQGQGLNLPPVVFIIIALIVGVLIGKLIL